VISFLHVFYYEVLIKFLVQFFLNFCQATMIFTLYVLGTLVGFNVSAWTTPSSSSHVDAQIIVVSALYVSDTYSTQSFVDITL